MSTLYLADVKQFMHIGQERKESVCMGVIEDNGAYRPNQMLVGSVLHLLEFLDKLDAGSKDKDIVLCLDSVPTEKRRLAETVLGVIYKGGRPKAPEHVTYQYEFTKKILPQIGYNYLCVEGLEADDIIASVVLKYKDVYDNVVIFTNDSDQYYLIDKKVEVQSIRRDGRCVNYSNYRSYVKNNRLVQYNSINLIKLIEGETSDNIPPLRADVTEKLLKMIPAETYPYLGNMNAFRTVFKNIVGADDEESLAIFDLINPILNFGQGTTIERGKQVDYKMQNYYLARLKGKKPAGEWESAIQLGDSTILQMLDEINGGR